MLPIDPGLLPATRLHPFPILPDAPARIFLKRDDEAGYALAAGKKRKFASLIPFLKQQQYAGAIVIGGANSNNVLAATQLLPEHGLQAHLLVKAAHAPSGKGGNAFLTDLLHDCAARRIVPAKDWPQAETLALQWQAGFAAAGLRQFVLPEGAYVAQALPGAAALATDLLRNEAELSLQFSHIFVDAGTGLSAAALVLALASSGHKAMVHIVSMAEPEPAMQARITQCAAWWQDLGMPNVASDQLRYRIWQPRTARSFGSVNRAVLDAIQRYARQFGVLTEPIYAAKLLMEAELLIPELGLQGDIVLVHSGGLQSLPGFSHKLRL